MMRDRMNLQGKIALITGGGRRLGLGITEALAAAGCRVIIHYGHSRHEAEATAETLRAKGSEAVCLSGDLTEAGQIETMFEEVRDRFGRLDLLVNNAANFHKQGLENLETTDWDRVMGVNLRAPFLCMRSAAPLLRIAAASDSSPSSVVNIADLSGLDAWPGYAHHGASKAGLLHLTRVAAREMAPQIRVNSVIPGPILPPLGADTTDAGWLGLVARIPMARSGIPAEVGAAVVFLAESDFITGESIAVDGGEHLLGAGHRRL